jgi:pimeloyl-ACP methyl ester carboxylesterase
MRDVTTSIQSAAGELRAIVGYPGPGGTPPGSGALPGLVLVDGAGPSAADQWGEQPATFGGCGAVVLTHDKPGCGGSPGDWREQDLAGRAADTLAALEVLRAQPGVDPGRVGLLGISQGGWVSYLAASLAPRAVRHLVVISGPGVDGFEQERYRIGCAVNGDPEALAWVDERARLLLAGADPTAITARQLSYTGRPWYEGACEHYGPDLLPLYARIGGFDPADVLPVFPAAGHALMLSPWDESAPYAPQLAPGSLPMLTGWLAAN